MECARCKLYKSDFINMHNSCDLFAAENFIPRTKENPCEIVSDDYIATEDCEPFGIVKGENLLDYLEM